MDVFIEKIVARKKTALDYIIVAVIVIAGISIAFAAVSVKQLGAIGLFAGAAAIYGVFYFFKIRNIEYEYSLTNGDMDIDMIIAQRKRKRVLSANCKEFEFFGKVVHEKYNEVKNISKKIEAISSKDAKEVYFFITHYKGQRTLVLFEPDERMINSIKSYIPKRVFI